jgi:NADH-quinone oxidoreductase subunit F
MGNTICAFGEGTAMPALGYLKKFRKDFEAYVRGERRGEDAKLVVEEAGA